MLRGDPAAAAMAYTPDAWWRGQGIPDASGREAIQRLLVTHLAAFKYSTFRFEPEDYQALGDHAYESGRLVFARRAAADTADRPGTFRYLTVWKRLPDGTWANHRYMNTTFVAPRPQ